MPPRTANPEPAVRRPSTADELASKMYESPSNVIVTGFATSQPARHMMSPMREAITTAQQAVQFATSPGQSLAGMTPDFLLISRPSPDRERIVQAISRAADRSRFR